MVQKSNLHTLARKHNLYDLDRKSNGISLAKSADNFGLDPTGRSKDLPLHSGSHDKWDDVTVQLLRKYEGGLRKFHKKLEIPPIKKEELQELLIDIEDDLLFELKKMPKEERLK